MKTKHFTLTVACLAALAAVALHHHGRQTGARDSVAKRSDDAANRLRALEAYGKIPLTFEENSGQTDARVKFLMRGPGYTVFLTDRDATLRLGRPSAQPGAQAKTGAVVRIALAGANSHPVAHADSSQVAHANYFVGNDPHKWRHDVPEYARVKFDAVYPGIDLVYYGNQGRLESDYVLSPGANPKRIALRVEGADRVRLNSDGDAILSTALGDVSLHQPRAYQESEAGRVEVAANYTSLASGTLGIHVGKYDATLPLIIDPVVGYATLLSGSANGTTGNGIAVDAAGNTYIVGATGATDFPTTAGAFQTTRTGPLADAFVTKLNATGTALVFSTYLGGSGQPGKFDSASGVAVDPSGNVYVTGATPSTDFPILSTNAFQVVNKGAPLNCFLTKLDPTGSTLLYSSYLGDSGSDGCTAIALDSNGNAYLTGTATSTNFPVTPGAVQSAGQASGLAFISRFNTMLSGTQSLVYSTLIGGSSANQGMGIGVDAAFNAYITGSTSSADFPVTAGAFQTAIKGTGGNAFVARVDTTMPDALLYASYLGGTAPSAGAGDIGTAIAVGSASTVFVTGNTSATDFPVTTGVLQSTAKNVNKTTFVARFDMTKILANSLVYSTYLGGSSQESAAAIAIDASGNAYVAGTTQSSDFPTTPGAPQFTRTSQNQTGYVSVLNSTGTALSFSTFFGGTSGDAATGIAIDAAAPPNIYVTGATASPDFPVTAGAFQTTFKQGAAFVAKLSPANVTGVILSPSPLNFGNQIVGVTSRSLVVTLANLTGSSLTITKVSIAGTHATDFAPGTSTCGVTVAAGATCSLAVTFTPSIVGAETATLTVADSDPSGPQTVTLNGTGTPPPSPVFLTPATVNFGNQGLNTKSTAQTVTLRNTSTATVKNIVVSITGAGASSFAETSACGATLATGANCTISVTFTPTAAGAATATLSVADSDASSPQTATLTGTGTGTTPDFTIAASPTTAIVAAGSTANTTVTVTGLNSFASPVALTCTGAPAGSTCSLNPTSVTPTATGATSAGTIVTTARTAPAMAFRVGSRPTMGIRPGIWNAALAMIGLSLALFVWMMRRIGAVRKLAWTFSALLMLSLTSCSGLPSTGTPAGTYTITITGTSGTLTHSATVTLTVS
jgi:hypothetical protein